MMTCPKCGTVLKLTLQEIGDEEKGANTPAAIGPRPRTSVSFIMGGRHFSLSREDIENAAKQLLPSTINKYYIVLPDAQGHERRYPIKQAVRHALRSRSSDRFRETNFTAHRARDVLRRLGFHVGEQ